jgi:calcineurin-like phosphoesterase family protein
MSVFFYSDPHFGHENINIFCERPFMDSHKMNKVITERWNEIVGDNDIVYLLGDIATPRSNSALKYIEKLNGHIVVVRGNHDKGRLLQELPVYTSRLFMNINGFKTVVQHRPFYYKRAHIEGKDTYSDHDKSLDEIYYQGTFQFCLHGHIHNNYNELWNPATGRFKKHGLSWTGLSLNLSCEVLNYYPISLEDIGILLEKRYNDLPKNEKNEVIFPVPNKHYKVPIPTRELLDSLKT